MKPVNYDHTPLNEYTTPLMGEPDYTNTGIIRALGSMGEKYCIGKIEYQSFFNEEYQYIISPEWSVIDGLDTSVFQGIPGIAMELRLEKYYRVNMQPVFITERTPSENREDLWELMQSVGLNYYDRFEWLIRTNLTSGNDNLIVERYRTPPRDFTYQEAMKDPGQLQPGDSVQIHSKENISRKGESAKKDMLYLLASGADLYFEKENFRLETQNRDQALMAQRLLCYKEKLDKFVLFNQ